MSPSTITLLFLLFAVIMFVLEKIPLGVTSMIVCIGLVVTGVLDVKTAFAGFIDSNVILFVSMFIVGGALFETGMANKIGGIVTKFAKTERMLIIAIMVIVGLMSGVLSNTGTAGLNACPPLLVGVGVATSVETAALLSKKALMRPLGSHNENERAASMEKLLEDGINAIGLGPQGMGGKYSVMGVHIENTARHPSTIGVAVNVGCWSHRRGHIIFDKDLNYTITTHSGVTL